MVYVILSYLFFPVVRLVIALRRRSDIRRILVIQTAKIGDVICATPVFRALAQGFPQAHVSALVNPVTQELLQGNPHVHEAVAIRPDFSSGLLGKLRLARLIRRGRYDVAVNLNPNVPFAVCLFWGLVPIRLSVMPNFAGTTFRFASRLFTHLEPHRGDRLVVQTYLDVLKSIGVHTSNLRKDVYKVAAADEKAATVFASVTKPVIGIAVSSANKLKQLSAARIANSIESLLARGDVHVVLIGSRHDRRDADEVLAFLGDTIRVIDAVGMFTLRELPALFERLAVFVGVDSGLTYMADACGTPLV